VIADVLLRPVLPGAPAIRGALFMPSHDPSGYSSTGCQWQHQQQWIAHTCRTFALTSSALPLVLLLPVLPGAQAIQVPSHDPSDLLRESVGPSAGAPYGEQPVTTGLWITAEDK
jgi:hypothetical protein